MKKNKSSLIILIIGIIMVICVGVALFIGLSKNEGSLNKEKNNNGKNVVEVDGNNYTVKMQKDYLNINEVLESDDKTKLEFANVTVSDLKVDGKSVKVEITNIPSGDSCKEDQKYFSTDININNKNAFTIIKENCDKIGVEEIFIFEDKYVGVVYSFENKFIISIYTTSGESVYERTVLTVDAKTGKFTGYEEFDSDYVINYYELQIKEGEVTDYMYERGTKSYCDNSLKEGKC